MEELTNSMNNLKIEPVSTKPAPKKRIYKKKEVPTAPLNEPVVDQPSEDIQISSAVSCSENTVVLLPNRNDVEQPSVVVSSSDDDCSSVGVSFVVQTAPSNKPVKKITKKQTKKQEEKENEVSEIKEKVEETIPAVIPTDAEVPPPPKKKPVKKIAKKQEEKENEVSEIKEKVEEVDSTSTKDETESTESKSKQSKKSKKKDAEEKIKMTEIKPKSVSQFFAILEPFIRQNTHYVGLRENAEGLILPVFFTITGNYDREKKRYPVSFFRETVTVSEENGEITTKPQWDNLWQTGFITQSQCINMLPYDETHDYSYTPKTVEEQKTLYYNA